MTLFKQTLFVKEKLCLQTDLKTVAKKLSIYKNKVSAPQKKYDQQNYAKRG